MRGSGSSSPRLAENVRKFNRLVSFGDHAFTHYSSLQKPPRVPTSSAISRCPLEPVDVSPISQFNAPSFTAAASFPSCNHPVTCTTLIPADTPQYGEHHGRRVSTGHSALTISLPWLIILAAGVGNLTEQDQGVEGIHPPSNNTVRSEGGTQALSTTHRLTG